MSRDAGGAPLDLTTTQHWVQAVVVAPGDIDAALHSAPAVELVAPELVTQHVRPSATLTSAERLAIYHDMYLLRMEEALAADYPAVKHYLGGERFGELVAAYVAAHPSRSYTLNRLGDALPRFITGWAALGRAVEDPEPTFLGDLAQVELAITAAFDADESPSLSAEALTAVGSESFSQLLFEPIASLRMVTTHFELGPHLVAAREGRKPVQRLSRKSRVYLIFRRDYAVRRIGLGAPEAALLSAILAGSTLGDAVEAVGLKQRAARDPERVFGWFRRWVALGLFSNCRIDASTGK